MNYSKLIADYLTFEYRIFVIAFSKDIKGGSMKNTFCRLDVDVGKLV